MSNSRGITEEYEQDCYHEAAHAVFYHHAGLVIRSVRVTGTTGGLGTTCTADLPSSASPQQLVAVAAGDLAAWYAEYRRLGDEQVRCMSFEDFSYKARYEDAEMFGIAPDVLEATMPPEFDSDFGGALKLLERAANSPENSYGDLEGCYKGACARIESGLVDWWTQIEAVATSLMDAGSLDGAEIIRMIESASGKRPGA